MSHAFSVRLRTCGSVLASIGALTLALASTASAHEFTPANGEALETAVTEANTTFSGEANKIVLHGGTVYLPAHTLTIENTHGTTIEGPTTFPGAKIEGGSLEAERPTLIAVHSGAPVTLKWVGESTAGNASAAEAAIEDSGALTIENAAVAGNNGTSLLVQALATATVKNSTVSDSAGSGIVVAGGGSASLTNATVVNDKTGNIENTGTLGLTNTIIAQLPPPSGPGYTTANCEGSPASPNSHSLSSDGTCGTSLLSTAPLLGPLRNAGGPTTIHAIQPSSPAIDVIPKAECPTTDQRGVARPDEPPAEATCDIGAFESNQIPTVTSVVPNEVGSAGGVKIKVHGTEFTELVTGKGGLHFGTVGVELKPTGTLTKGTYKALSRTELEVDMPFHEHGKVHTTVTNSAGTSAETAADEMIFWPEIYKAEAAIGAARIPNIGYGQIQLNSPQINNTIECVNLGFGDAWNEANVTGGPISGHGEILVWWASGHSPVEGHTELSSRCRFIYHGETENQPTSPIAWASAEPPLHEVIQEGIVCTEKTEKELSECPLESQRSHENIIREISREGLSLPWNIQFTEKEGKPHVRIGLPEECKGKTGAERTELTKCPEASEREPGKSPAACNIPPTPDPPGCVKVEILSNPPLNVHLEFEGYVEPLGLNLGPNGLAPSEWQFEGHEKGEPTLHLRETPATEGSTTGSVKILGYAGQELITVK